MTNEQLEALKAAALAATPQNIDSAESVERHEGGYLECPTCSGEGSVEIEADYCNYDGKALGVQFYGIGPEHGAAEAYFRAASPAQVLSLIERLERAEAAAPAPAIADTAGAKPMPIARVSYRVEADGDTYSFFEWLGDVPPQGTLLYAENITALTDAQIQRLWVFANTKRVPEFIEAARAFLASPAIDAAGESEEDVPQASVAVVVKDLIECLMLWNGQAFAGLDMDALEGLRDELNSVIAKESGNER